MPGLALWSTLLAFALGACSRSTAVRAEPKLEELVDTATVSANLKPRVPLKAHVEEAEGVRHFVAEYDFPRRDPRHHYLVTVSMARSAIFLDPDGGASADAPDIGLRARREVLGFGPGGSAFGLTFTTCDGRHDVRVTVANLLPTNVTAPDLDLASLARTVSARYDAASGVRCP